MTRLTGNTDLSEYRLRLTAQHSDRFFIRDPGGNRIEIAEFTQHKTDS